MKLDDILIWALVAALAAAILFTLLFAPRRTRHGYGALGGEGTILTYAGYVGYR